MTETENSILPNFVMIKDAFFSLVFIIGGNSLRLKIDTIIASVHSESIPNQDSLMIWEVLLKATSWVSMMIGIIVGCIMAYSFIEGKIKDYKIKRNKNS